MFRWFYDWSCLYYCGVGVMDVEIKSKDDALTMGLFLAVTAKHESQRQECIELAETIAQDMTAKQVDLCKKAVECMLEYETQHA